MKPVTIQRRAEQNLFDAIDHYAALAPRVVELLLTAIDDAMRAVVIRVLHHARDIASLLSSPGRSFVAG